MKQVAFILLLARSVAAGVSLSAPPVQLSLGVHHLVDGALLSGQPNGTYFAMGAVSKDTAHPVIVPQHPWEAALHFYTSLLFLPASVSSTGRAQWLLYYACASADSVLFFSPIGLCVATSSDGVAFMKPLLPLHPYTANGTLPPVPTNIVFVTEPNTFGLQVFLDSRPSTPSSARVVLLYESSPVRFLYAATSPDGLVFTPSAAGAGSDATPALPFKGLADTMASAAYDAARDRYIVYGRVDKAEANSSTRECAGANPVFRWLQQTAKECAGAPACNVSDPVGWSTPEVVLAPGAPDAADCLDNYNPAAFVLPDSGTGSLYLMLPSHMRHIPRNDSGAPDDRAGANDGILDVRLAVSRDGGGRGGDGGSTFAFPSRDAFISRGVGARDPASGLYNASGSERDAGFVFATNTGLLDADLALPTPPALPSPSVDVLYWGSQTTHAGGGAYLGRYWPGAFSGVFRARMRREGWVGLATLPYDPVGAGSATTVALLLPAAGAAAGPAAGAAAGAAPPLRLLMHLNADISAAGAVSVAFLDAATLAPIPGFGLADCATLHGNGVRQLIQCSGAGVGGDLSPLLGRPVALHLQLTHAKVYAWQLSHAV